MNEKDLASELLSGQPHGGNSIVFPKRKPLLHAMLAGCGFNVENDLSYRWHGLERGSAEFAIWQYTISGKGALLYEEGTFELAPGDAMMIHVPHDHLYFLPDDSDHWEFLYLNLHGRDLTRLWLEMERSNGPTYHFKRDSHTVRLAVEILLAHRNGGIQTPRKASALGYEFIMSLLDEVAPDAAFGSGNDERPPFIRKVVQYALANAGNPIGVEDLAKVAGIGRFHFSRLFSKWYDMPPSVFLREIRVEKAVRLLQTERLTIKEVAERCGFSDASYFCKVFRKTMGVSPEAFRKGE
ncbi:MAG: AraC family transcriptional regulator [Kiritimatiellaeota bacterium]|nr:AraC family transcriptional regulator [Kiritimatiellota bacterium]